MGKKLTSISIDDFSENVDYSIVENYFISDSMKENREINAVSLEYPICVEGILFILCIKGTTKLQINMREYNIDEKTLLTILPGSVYEVVEYSEDILFEYIFLSVDFVYDLNVPSDVNILEKMFQHPILDLTEEQFNSLLEFYSFMMKQYKRENHKYRELLSKNLLSAFIVELFDIYAVIEGKEVKINSHKEKLIQQFIKLLIENIRFERTVQFYADKMCLSPKYLSQLIKKISGASMMEWINGLTIVYIKAMLKTSELSILQISDELNFPNASFFGSYFKKHTGMTPIQYRDS